MSLSSKMVVGKFLHFRGLSFTRVICSCAQSRRAFRMLLLLSFLASWISNWFFSFLTDIILHLLEFDKHVFFEVKELSQVHEADWVLRSVNTCLAVRVTWSFLCEQVDKVLLEEIVEFVDCRWWQASQSRMSRSGGIVFLGDGVCYCLQYFLELESYQVTHSKESFAVCWRKVSCCAESTPSCWCVSLGLRDAL